ncbi:peptidoglycan endopeptidase [Sphingomonas sp. Leaf25]|uniref:peptidoglycan endopeptidase n=1 Tax=Sphingomonas sp. Leaf25 TaxID=1735692 RepID=UPI000ABE4358|nr:peptidoglycan endopeptidase [Sphingomonas sp. Leaf25]
MSAVVARARAAVGARFRVQGRSMEDGFDCVGLVGWATGRAVPQGYPARCGDALRAGDALAEAGFVAVGAARAGDVLLLASAPGQLHLAIVSELGIIHADGVARRVVERPGVPPWPVIGVWRMEEAG